VVKRASFSAAVKRGEFWIAARDPVCVKIGAYGKSVPNRSCDWEYYSPIDQKSDESKLDQQNPTRNATNRFEVTRRRWQEMT